MSSAQGHVFIKHAGDGASPDEVYVKVKTEASDLVADLTKRASTEFGWGTSSRVHLHLVKKGGKENPTAEEEASAVALDKPAYPLDEVFVTSGSWLLARMSQPAAVVTGASLGESLVAPTPFIFDAPCLLRCDNIPLPTLTRCFPPPGGIDLERHMDKLAERLERSLAFRAPANRVVKFSEVTSTAAANAVSAVGVGLGGRLALPDGLDRFMPATALDPFDWAGGRGEKKEVEESPALLALLERWVKCDAEPPVRNLFLDVQAGPAMSMQVEGVADFSGVPDAIVVARGIGSPEEAEPFAASAVLTVDWKRRSAMQVRGRIAAIGHVHALALASTHNFTDG